MLLWLYGLRFQKTFPSLVSRCKSLCSPFGNSFNPDAFCYYIYTSSFLAPLAIISTIETSDSAQNVFSSSSEFSKFLYPSDPSKLFEAFCEYVRKIFVALKFLCIQCDRNAGHAGWQYCYFGQKCSEKFLGNSLDSPPSSASSGFCSSCPNSGAYLCTAINKDKVHDHCNGSASTQNSCLGFGSTSTSCDPSSAHPQSNGQGKTCTPCPHPLLNFLIADFSDSQSSDSKSLFKLPKDSSVPPMGFSKDHLPTPGRNGHVLHGAIKYFCLDGFYPLTRLVQFSLCVSRTPPETLGELFAFFVKFKDSGVFKNNFESYVSEEPGWYSGSDLKKALEDLYGSHSGSHSDLKSLSSCDGGSTCGKYLYPLTENAYKDFIEDFLDTYLSWVCYSAEKFKEKLEDFYNEALTKSLQCCLKSSGSCEKIVTCPCALPFLYSFGFGFWGPKTLSGGKKSCQNFVTQLGKVLEENSPLDLLIKQ
ncbi:57-kDa merozoite antigen, partial [Babesia divergens]